MTKNANRTETTAEPELTDAEKACVYADAMIKRGKVRPQWERELATGARDPGVDYSRGR